MINLIRHLTYYFCIVLAWNAVVILFKGTYTLEVPSLVLVAASTTLGMLLSMRIKIGYERFYEARGHLARFQGTAKNILRILHVLSSRNDKFPAFAICFHEIIGKLHTALCDFSHQDKLSFGKVLKSFSKNVFEEIKSTDLDLRIYSQIENELSTLNRCIYELLKIRYTQVPAYYDQVINFLAIGLSFVIPLSVQNTTAAVIASSALILIYQTIAFYNKRTLIPFGKRKYDINVTELLQDVKDEVDSMVHSAMAQESSEAKILLLKRSG